MKTQSLFICALLVCFTFGSEINPSTTDVLAELKTTDFGKGVMQLIQFTSGSEDSKTQPIIDLLDTIKAHIESEKDLDQQNHDVTISAYTKIISMAQSQYDTAVGDLAALDADLVTATACVSDSDDCASTANAEVVRLTTVVAEQESFMADEEAAYDVRQQRNADAIEACNAALACLGLICGGTETSPTVLIQTSNSQLSSTTRFSGQTGLIQLTASQGEELKAVTSQFQTLGKTDTSFLPLINALTVLAQTSTDEVSIEQTITLITDLRDDISTAKLLDSTNYPASKQCWQDTLDDYNTQLATQVERESGHMADSLRCSSTQTQLTAQQPLTTQIRDDALNTVEVETPKKAEAITNFNARENLRAKQLALIAQVQQIFVNAASSGGVSSVATLLDMSI